MKYKEKKSRIILGSWILLLGGERIYLLQYERLWEKQFQGEEKLQALNISYFERFIKYPSGCVKLDIGTWSCNKYLDGI